MLPSSSGDRAVRPCRPAVTAAAQFRRNTLPRARSTMHDTCDASASNGTPSSTASQLSGDGARPASISKRTTVSAVARSRAAAPMAMVAPLPLPPDRPPAAAARRSASASSSAGVHNRCATSSARCARDRCASGCRSASGVNDPSPFRMARAPARATSSMVRTAARNTWRLNAACLYVISVWSRSNPTQS